MPRDRQRERERRNMKVNHRIHPRSSRTTTIPSILLLTTILLHPTPPNTTTPPPLFASAQGKFPSGYITPTAETHCWTPCQTTPPDTNVAVPDTNCKLFYVCRQGRVTNRLTCSEGRLFDSNIAACNHEGLVECIDPRCPPTARPTRSPSVSPTEFPTEFPTESPTKFPTWTPTGKRDCMYHVHIQETEDHATNDCLFKQFRGENQFIFRKGPSH
mmetsp:Transcript_9380/g.19781  ORF Transcript_9380/g.19781 Transcript_9380/m.19781 type:complete len:215 (-) Transcript_9380:1752-2396(-)